MLEIRFHYILIIPTLERLDCVFKNIELHFVQILEELIILMQSVYEYVNVDSPSGRGLEKRIHGHVRGIVQDSNRDPDFNTTNSLSIY